MGWHEQFKINRALYGRPDLILTCPWVDSPSIFSKDHGFTFYLQNPGSHTAVNVHGLDITLPLPRELLIRPHEDDSREHTIELTEDQTRLVISFTPLDCVMAGDKSGVVLPYHVKGLLDKDLASILHVLAEDDTISIPMVVGFSNIGEPPRQWHAHFLLEYALSKGIKMNTHLLVKTSGFGEVSKSAGTCSRCHRTASERAN